MRVKPEEVEEQDCQAVLIPSPKATQLVNIVRKLASRSVLSQQFVVMPLMESRENGWLSQLQESYYQADPGIGAQSTTKSCIEVQVSLKVECNARSL
jgi:hypothetical protein